MRDLALEVVTDQVLVVDLRQVEVTQGRLCEIAEGRHGAVIGGAVLIQQGEPLNVLGAVGSLHVNLHLAEGFLVLHIRDLEDMDSFGNQGIAAGKCNFSHDLFPP